MFIVDFLVTGGVSMAGSFCPTLSDVNTGEKSSGTEASVRRLLRLSSFSG